MRKQVELENQLLKGLAMCRVLLCLLRLQVYDLSKLEGDEYGLTGGSPPPMRDSL